MSWGRRAWIAVMLCATLGAHAGELTVSAAASLANAFKDLGPLFDAAHPGHTVHFNHGASGGLLQQIIQGAPVDVFASADQETMDQAQSRGLVEASQRRNFASNTLVVIVPAQARVPGSLADLTQAAYRRIAIGLPASVPAGRYAKGALQAAGHWAQIEPRTIGANNVRQVLDYVARGEVEAGFVYASDAAVMPVKVKVAFVVPTAVPILYPAAPLVSSPRRALARQFVDFLSTPQARSVLARHGFGVP